MTSERASEFSGETLVERVCLVPPHMPDWLPVAPWRLCQVAGPCSSHGLSRCRPEHGETGPGVQGEFPAAVVIKRQMIADEKITRHCRIPSNHAGTLPMEGPRRCTPIGGKKCRRHRSGITPNSVGAIPAACRDSWPRFWQQNLSHGRNARRHVFLSG